MRARPHAHEAPATVHETASQGRHSGPPPRSLSYRRGCRLGALGGAAGRRYFLLPVLVLVLLVVLRVVVLVVVVVLLLLVTLALALVVLVLVLVLVLFLFLFLVCRMATPSRDSPPARLGQWPGCAHVSGPPPPPLTNH